MTWPAWTWMVAAVAAQEARLEWRADYASAVGEARQSGKLLALRFGHPT